MTTSQSTCNQVNKPSVTKTSSESERLRATPPSAPKKTILSYAKDLPNICSLVGLLCAVLAIYSAVLEIFPAAMIGMIWAVFFDWTDGIIARRMNGRNDEQRFFGAQLDSLIDIVSFGICPAVVLLSYGHFSPWYIPGAFIIIATGVLRLSYFNVFGLVGESTYMGLALDNNIVILVFAFLFNGLMSHTAFSVFIYFLFMVLAAFNVAPIKTPKLAGRWYYALTVYALVLTAFYGGQLLYT